MRYVRNFAVFLRLLDALSKLVGWSISPTFPFRTLRENDRLCHLKFGSRIFAEKKTKRQRDRVYHDIPSGTSACIVSCTSQRTHVTGK